MSTMSPLIYDGRVHQTPRIPDIELLVEAAEAEAMKEES